MGNNLEYSSPKALIHHPKFERSSIVHNNRYMKVEFAIENETDVTSWEEKLTYYKERLQIEEYLLLPESYELSEKGFCGSSCILTVYYPTYPYVFQDEILNRVKKN